MLSFSDIEKIADLQQQLQLARSLLLINNIEYSRPALAHEKSHGDGANKKHSDAKRSLH